MLPIVYSFRRCPYAMRARLALFYSGVTVELREVVLSDKPAEMQNLADEVTVPLLLLPDQTLIDESWDVMLWAIRQNDPDLWLGEGESKVFDAEIMVEMNDFSFKTDLDHYKYSDRYPEHPLEYYRSRGEEYLQDLEDALSESKYLLGEKISIADIAIFPFIRQFAFVDKHWFDQAPYPNLQCWLQKFLDSELFDSIMVKFPAWKQGDEPVIFPA